MPTPSPSEHAQHEFTAGIAAPRTARLLDIAIGAALARQQAAHYPAPPVSPIPWTSNSAGR